MPKLVVVEKPESWKFSLEDVDVVTPDDYISKESFQSTKNLRVLNLCKSYQYQSEGYYVSLLAEARGHKVLHGVSTIQDFRFPSILREDSLDFDELIQNTFKNEPYDRIEFNIYFGMTRSEDLNRLAQQLFQMVQAPSLRAVMSDQDNPSAVHRRSNASSALAPAQPAVHRVDPEQRLRHRLEIVVDAIQELVTKWRARH